MVDVSRKRFLTIFLTVMVLLTPVAGGVVIFSQNASAESPYIDSLELGSEKIAPGQSIDVSFTICNNNYLRFPVGLQIIDDDIIGTDVLKTDSSFDTKFGDGCVEYTLSDYLSYSDYERGGEEEIEVELRMEDDVGNVDYLGDEQSLSSNEPPEADFTMNPDRPTPGVNAGFDATGSSDPNGDLITTYEWDFDGDGEYEKTSSGAFTDYTFSDSENQDVTLRVTDEYGATDSVTKTVEVNKKPTADFDISPESPEDPGDTEGAEVTFFGFYSSDPDGEIDTYEWVIESQDGGLVKRPSGSSPTVDMLYAGEYEATLRVTDSDGATDSTTKTFTVEKANQPPSAESTTVSTGESSSVSEVFEASDPDGDSLDYSVDGSANHGSVTISGREFTYSPNSGFTGDDSFTYRVTDGNGGSDTAQISVSVTDDTAPTPDAGNDKTTGIGNTVSLDGSESSDNVGITSYEWDIDDDGSYEKSGPTAAHSFGAPGTKTVTLRVADDAGNTATDTVKITAEDRTSPTAAAGGDTSGGVGESITFDGSSSSDNVEITSYEWDIDADSTYEKSGQTISHAFESTGTKTVTLRVKDAAGNTATDSVTITIVDAEPPTADAGSDKTGSLDESLTFDASGSSDNVGIVSYEWDVDGDGTYEKTGKRVSQSYAEPGTTKVTVRVEDAAGNTATDTVEVSIEDTTDPKAVAGPDRTVSPGETVRLDGTDSFDNIEVVDYHWDIDGDGAYEESGVEVTTAFETAGTTTVKLQVRDEAGNTDTDTVGVTVEEKADTKPPDAEAGADKTVTTGETVELDGSASTDNREIATSEWDIDDDGTYEKSGARIEHVFETAGTTQVTLQVTDTAGNTDTDTVSIQVEDESDDSEVTAEASGPYTVTANETVGLDASESAAANSEIVDTNWELLNESGTIEESTYYAPAELTENRTLTLQLTVTTSEGATDTDTATITVEQRSGPDDPSPSLNLRNLTVGNTETPVTIAAGTNKSIEAVIENPSGTEETVTTELTLGQIEKSQETTVGADSTDTVRFENVTADLAAGNYTVAVQTKQHDTTLRGDLTVRDTATEPSQEIKQAEDVASAVTGGDDKQVAAEQLVVAAATNDSLTIGGSAGRTIEIRHPETDRRLEVTPETDSSITTEWFALDVYDADGSLSDDPTISDLENGRTIPARISGDENIFTDIDGPFTAYSLALLEDDGVIDTTAARQIGIGYPNSFEQNATNGTVRVTLPREDAVSEDWHAEFDLEVTADGGPIVSREIEHTEQDDVFSVTINGSDIEQGSYDSRITLENTSEESVGSDRVISISSPDAIVVGDPAEIAPTVDVTAEGAGNGDSPIRINAFVEDRVPETATVAVRNPEGAVVFTENVTDAFQDPRPVSRAVDWDPVTQSGDPLPDGEYTAVITAEDEFGNEVEAQDTIALDTTPPTVDAVGVVSDAVTNTEEDIVLGANVTSAPSNLSTVELGIDATSVAYTRTKTLNSSEIDKRIDDDRVEMAVDPETLATAVGEGNFTVTARATDMAGNTEVVTNDTVTIDTSVDGAQARVTASGPDRATLRVTAGESVTVTNIDVVAEAADGTTEDRTPAAEDILNTAGQTFEIPFDGSTISNQDTTFTATAELEDAAGNTETVMVNTSVTGYELTDGEAVVDPDGTDAAFTLSAASTADNGSRRATVGQTAMAPAGTALGADQIAPTFIDVTDIGLTEAELQNATVRIPVETIDMDGVTPEELVYFYSPDGSDEYQVLEPELENGDLVVEVDGFSQLAPGRVDDQSPTVSITTSETPQSNATLEVSYEDELSGINVSSVDVSVNGNTVTAADGLQVTESNATYDLADNSTAEHTVSVEVTDEAGNTAQKTKSIQDGQTRPAVTEISGLDGTTLANDTDAVELEYEYESNSLDTGATTLSITADGSTSHVSPVVDDGQISYELDVAEGTDYTADLTVANEAGETSTTTEFSVARGDQADDGDDQAGGGGAGGMPNEEESTTQTELFEFEDATTVRLSEVPRSGSADIDTSSAVTGGPFDLTRVQMQFRFDVPNFRLEITDPRAEAGPAPTLPDAAGTPVGFIEVDAIGADQATVDRTTATLTVDEGAVPDGGSTADLTAYQYVDGEWRSLATDTSGGTLTATLATHEAEHIALAVESGTDADPDASDDSNTTNETESTGGADSDENESTDPPSDQPADDQSTDEIPGFGALTAIGAVVTLLLYSRIRRQL